MENSGSLPRIATLVGRLHSYIDAKLAGNDEHRFRHSRRNVPIEARFVPDLSPTELDFHFSERLLAAYNKSLAVTREPPGYDTWVYLRASQQDYLELLEKGDVRGLATYLCNMCRHSATRGTIQGHLEYARLRRSPAYRRKIAQLIKERLVCLAEGVGALRIENPERGQFGKVFSLPVEDLVKRIDGTLGLDTTPPPIDGGLFKIVVGDRAYGERDCTAIYTAFLLTQQLPQAANIAEIGGGAGRLAYWAQRMGVQKYTIYDLPHIAILQGFYLLKAGMEVSLFDEPERSICLRPGDVFPSNKYDLVVNQDSFPEIHPDIVKNYLRGMRECAPHFLSINHESEPMSRGKFLQRSVPTLVAEVGGFHRVERSLFWGRPGYCVEKYAVTQKGNDQSVARRSKSTPKPAQTIRGEKVPRPAS